MGIMNAVFSFKDGMTLAWEPTKDAAGKKVWNIAGRFRNWEISWDRGGLAPNQTNANYYRRKFTEAIQREKDSENGPEV